MDFAQYITKQITVIPNEVHINKRQLKDSTQQTIEKE